VGGGPNPFGCIKIYQTEIRRLKAQKGTYEGGWTPESRVKKNISKEGDAGERIGEGCYKKGWHANYQKSTHCNMNADDKLEQSTMNEWNHMDQFTTSVKRGGEDQKKRNSIRSVP